MVAEEDSPVHKNFGRHTSDHNGLALVVRLNCTIHMVAGDTVSAHKA